MKDILRKHKRLVLVAVAVLLVAIGGLGVWWRFIKEDPKKQETPEETISGPTIIKDHIVPEADRIIAQAKSPEEAAIQIISYGYLKMEVSKYQEAYDLFEKGTTIQGISEQTKGMGYVGMYKAAERLNDSGKQESAKQAMGEAVFQQYLQPSGKEGEQGE